jgi:hypothetical protein
LVLTLRRPFRILACYGVSLVVDAECCRAARKGGRDYLSVLYSAVV